ncbi:MAG: methyltransferase domain-containing protein [Aquabacterium sp.]|uniref:class I SAM-dependent methyltransferase n=1 Tax=Aquabacterium sp. TaxID=1872578 RepID=UPI0025C38E4D|nr:methyltransferase domain-containing protein [Aquabacterium sp.]MBI5927037.1 methyltransferase domain-containing protein [Aquabacterium sp.]
MNAPATFNAPPPALIVISGGAPASTSHERAARAAAPALQKLLAALQPADRVLELGCGLGELAQAYKARHGECHWVGVSSHPVQPGQMHASVNQTLSVDLHANSILHIGASFDLIIVNRLEHLPNAARTLAELGELLTPGGKLFVLAENHACLSAMAHLIEADPSTGIAALPDDPLGMDKAHPRFQSHSTIFKLLLDAGWTPSLADHVPEQGVDDKLAAAVRYMGDALGVPPGCADRVHRMKHFIIGCQRQFDDAVAPSSRALFDVVVPTTKEQQLRVNVEQSPGLQEVQARIISYRHAATPAEALTQSLQHVGSDWVLLCHQDVYFPKGFGQRLNALLSTISAEDRPKTLLGFIGMGVNRQTEQPEAAGFVIDRVNCADHAESDAVVSIDELALVIAKDSLHQIDPHIGWHLWATDLCLTSICTHRVFPRIVRMPLFHNTQSGWQLPESFYDSAEYILQKHSSFSTIHSLCGVIDQGFVARHRSTKP